MQDLLSPQSAKKHTSASQPKEEKPSTSAVTTEWTQVWDNAGKRSKAKKSKGQKEQQILIVENQDNSTISISNSEGSLQEAAQTTSRRHQVPNSTSDQHLVVNTCCQHAPVPVYCNQPQQHHHHCCAAYSGSKQRVTSNTCGLL
jgi:hypothetical protein